jgi:hypothetical protein
VKFLIAVLLALFIVPAAHADVVCKNKKGMVCRSPLKAEIVIR